ADVQKRIIINASELETRVALVEGNVLAELHVESGGGRSIVGNIYKGRVLRVLPGMQAAFVDVGLEKAAFMHVSDFWRAPAEGQDVGDVAEGDGADGGSVSEELTLEPSLAACADERDAAVPEPAMDPDEVEIFAPAEESPAESTAETASPVETALADDSPALEADLAPVPGEDEVFAERERESIPR